MPPRPRGHAQPMSDVTRHAILQITTIRFAFSENSVYGMACTHTDTRHTEHLQLIHYKVTGLWSSKYYKLRIVLLVRIFTHGIYTTYKIVCSSGQCQTQGLGVLRLHDWTS